MRFQLISLNWTFIRVPCFGIRSLTHPGDPWETFKVQAYFPYFCRSRRPKFRREVSSGKTERKTSKYGKYAWTLKVSHGSPGWVKDLIPKHGTLIKVQFRDISWNLIAPTPAGRPRGHLIWVYFTPYYSRENGGIFRSDLHCKKLQNSLNLMVILNY